ncbi:MAG: 2-amino-4-hydroxy-6-hydroxymethyldihydropteridine diphosphokinase [Ginsengibacter sp.]
MNKVFIITGGNIGDRKKNLETAEKMIEEKVGKIIQSSKIYETAAWGITDQPSFYNQVFIVETNFSADEVIKKILKIEEDMGRVRTIRNAARNIDIDILFFNDDIVNEENLTIPHPQISNRRFVLMPLNEIASTKNHPIYNKSVSQLLAECKDELKVTPLPA